jgi:hypothetical protein
MSNHRLDLDKDFVREPSENDVLCARGNVTHSGNLRFREMIKEHGPDYLRARSAGDKKEIVKNIIQEIQRRGGRFLTRSHIDKEYFYWTTIDDTKVNAEKYTGVPCNEKTKQTVKSQQILFIIAM